MSATENNVTDQTASKIHATPAVREQVIKGVRYVYEDHPYWDKTKKQTRHKRVYLGHYKPDGTYVTSKNKQQKESQSIQNKTITVEESYTYQFIGATYLLDKIAENIGLKDDLKEIFPEHYLQILSLSYFLTLENDNPFYRFSKWSKTHVHPCNEDIPSQRVSELLETITEKDKFELFKRQVKRIQDNEYLAYDTTSISSYSKKILQVKFGHNKDGDDLPQINLALVLGERSLSPAYYRLLPGNINDLTTLNKLLIDFKVLEMKNINLVMDRGFYSAENVHRLHKDEFKYIIGVKNNLSYVSQRIAELDSKSFNVSQFLPRYDVYCQPYDVFIPYQAKSNSFNITNSQRVRSRLFLFYDPTKANIENIEFNKKIIDAIEKMKQGTANTIEKNIINKYCNLDYNSELDNYKITYNTQSIAEQTNKFGFFSLLSNMKVSSNDILEIYRNKDVIEKSFNNLKNRLNFRRTNVHSYTNLEGQIFLQYISLNFILYIHRHMKLNNLYKNYTLETLIDQFDIIARFYYTKSDIHYSEITKKQIELYKSMNVVPLS